MAKTGLSRMLDELKRLTPDEQKQLREAIDRSLSVTSLPPSEDEFERELVESGILDEVPPRSANARARQNWRPMDIKGKPLSDTIIEERR